MLMKESEVIYSLQIPNVHGVKIKRKELTTVNAAATEAIESSLCRNHLEIQGF